MRWIALGSLLALTGCAGGAVLPDKPADVSNVAHIEIYPDERFWIWPIHADSNTETAIKAPGIWVTDGWFMIEDQCFSPKDHRDGVVIFDDDDYETIRVHAGHRYMLQCDSDVVAKINLFDLGKLEEK